MRLVAKLEQEDLARKFSLILKKEGIENTIESEIDDSNKRWLLIWVYDEDLAESAKQLFQEYQEHPDDSKFNVALAKENRKKPLIQELPIKLQTQEKKASTPLTTIIIGICVFIYALNFFQEFSISKKEGKRILVITPIQLLFFYDVPTSVLRLSEALRKYSLESVTSMEDLPIALQEEIRQIEEIPQWRGLYSWVLIKIRGDPITAIGPMFVKIRQGQIWRIFSPCILHTTFLHLLFNMLWVWLLGRQIEEKVKKWKIALMILIIGIISNTAQYLMSGPLFLGYSGIVVGMAGFIWAREKLAPWEGYTVHKSTFLFLAIFIFGMMGLQIFSFIFQSVGSELFQLNIANTAHIVGGGVGWILVNFHFFPRRSIEY